MIVILVRIKVWVRMCLLTLNDNQKGIVDKGHCVDASSYGGEIKGKGASKNVVNVYQGKSKDIEGDESKNNVGCV